MSSGAVRWLLLLLPPLLLLAARAHASVARDENLSAARAAWEQKGQPPLHLERLRSTSVVQLSEEGAGAEEHGQEQHEHEGHTVHEGEEGGEEGEGGHKHEGGHEHEGGREHKAGHEREEVGMEGEGEGEGEGEEHEFSESDFEVACMLLGSVSSVMVLLYLVNWNDDDIRRYTWKVLSTTISIFLAVLLFGGFNGLIRSFLHGWGEVVVCSAQILHSLVYIGLLQVSIAYISGTLWGAAGAVDLEEEVWVINDPLSKDNEATVAEENVRNKKAKRSAYLDQYGMEVPVMKITKELHRRRRSMKCYARLLAHMAGFAAINSGATLQQVDVFRATPLMALLPLVITQCTILVVFKCLGIFRQRLQASAEGQPGKNHHIKMYCEEVFEAENDISALSSSFLVVQVVRFAITGTLPNEEGLEVPELHKSAMQVGLLYVDGLLFALMSIALVVSLVMSGQVHENQEEEEEPQTLGGRILVIGMNATSMAFAWCVFFGGRWLAHNLGVGIETILGRVILALGVSALSCLAVFGLDMVDDRMVRHGGSGGDEAAAAAIQMIINALGILIGFSWERCFEGGVEAVASKTGRPVVIKCILGFLIAVGITPMWMRHILTKEMALQELKTDRKKHQLQHEALLSSMGNGERTV